MGCCYGKGWILVGSVAWAAFVYGIFNGYVRISSCRASILPNFMAVVSYTYTSYTHLYLKLIIPKSDVAWLWYLIHAPMYLKHVIAQSDVGNCLAVTTKTMIVVGS